MGRWLGLLCLPVLLALAAPSQRVLAGDDRTFTVVLEARTPAEANRTLEARLGDTVTLIVRSDEAITLHLHGYDRELVVPAGGQSRLKLDARIPGRFPIEAHDSHGHGPLLYLEVRPD